MQDALDDLAFPDAVEADLLVEPLLEPVRVGQAALHGVARIQRLVDVQVGRVQRLRRATRAGHQPPTLANAARASLPNFCSARFM